MSGERGCGLFEIFTQKWRDGRSISTLNSNAARIQSIQDHLSRLLNARHGALSHLPDYGLPDITQLYGDLPYTVDKLQKAIALCIEKYEPRVVNVDVVPMPGNRAEAVLIFEIRATLLSGQQAAFKTYLTSEGHAKVTHQKYD